MIGYLCAYLRYYYPTEFIASYLKNANNRDDIVNGTALAKQFGITIKPIQFRHSSANYIPVAKEKVIYKGLSSLKYFSDDIGEKLYLLKDQKFSSFIDFLKINPCDSRKTEALIKLDFFSEFGKSQYLLDIYHVYETYYSRKQINKIDCPISEEIMQQYATVTEKQYKITDKEGFINMLCANIKNQSIPITTFLETQKEFYGYIDYILPDAHDIGYVLSIDTKYSPKIEIYEFDTGKTTVYKLSKKDFSVHPIEPNSIIRFKYEQRFKSRKVDGKWIRINNEFEPWIVNYQRVLNFS